MDSIYGLLYCPIITVFILLNSVNDYKSTLINTLNIIREVLINKKLSYRNIYWLIIRIIKRKLYQKI